MDTKDLSYSKVVDMIQGEEIKGADLLTKIAEEREELTKEIKKLEAKLDSLQTRRGILWSGAKKIMKHLKLEAPLVVKRQSFIVVIDDENMEIERNVI